MGCGTKLTVTGNKKSGVATKNTNAQKKVPLPFAFSYIPQEHTHTRTHLTVKLLLSERKGKKVLLSMPSPHLGASPAHPFNLHSRYFPLPLLRSQTTQKLHCLPPTSSHCLVLSQSTANLCTQTHNKISK